jgi:hypothetical protein
LPSTRMRVNVATMSDATVLRYLEREISRLQGK